MRLIRSSLWTLIGGVIPAAAAIVTVPLIVSRVGEVHYGLLTLITAIVGYFALLDVNATQGSVKYLAQYKSRQDMSRMAQVFCLGAGLYLVIGAVGGAAIASFARPLASTVFNVPLHLQDLSVQALKWGGLAFFFAQLQMYLLSVPQAVNRFDMSARSEVVFGSLTSLSTVVIVLAGGGIVEIMAARAALAAANVAWLSTAVLRLLPELRPVWPGRQVARDLMSFSMFTYLSRIASVTHVSADKLLIGAYVDMKALAYFAVPFLLVNRLYALTYRLGSVMLPEASRLDAHGQHEQLVHKYLMAARYLLFINVVIAVLLLTLGRELLWYWAGPSFGPEATVILLLLVTGALLSTVSNLPSHITEGLGRPAITGSFAVARAALGMLCAWVGVVSHGILGVAWAQLLVALVMLSAFLAWVHGRVIPATLGEFVRTAVLPSLWPLAAALFMACSRLGSDPLSLQWTLGLGALVFAGLLAYGYWFVLQTAHRASALAYVAGRVQALRARQA